MLALSDTRNSIKVQVVLTSSPTFVPWSSAIRVALNQWLYVIILFFYLARLPLKLARLPLKFPIQKNCSFLLLASRAIQLMERSDSFYLVIAERLRRRDVTARHFSLSYRPKFIIYLSSTLVLHKWNHVRGYYFMWSKWHNLASSCILALESRRHR